MRQQLTSFDKLDPSYLLRKNLEREKDLKRLPPGDPEAGNIHSKMRRDYRTLIMEHFQFVHREKRDIHGLLWKTCFYKQIEEYRHSIRGHSNKLNSLYAEQSMGMFKAKEIEFEQAYLNRLTLSFVQYLNDSVVFYQRLLSDLEDRSNIPVSTGWIHGVGPGPSQSASAMEMIVRSLHRCYLCLGDLARYKELYNEQREIRDFTDASRFYERAALIMPVSGNAHNQMAVLSAYSDDEFYGVFYYCRSIMVKEPFMPGLENLNSLFVKNSKAYDDSYVQGISINSQQAKLNSSIMKLTNNSWKLNTFLFRFIYLHGLLFRWSCDMHHDYLMRTNNNNNSRSYDQPSPPSEQFDTLRKLLDPVMTKRMAEKRDLPSHRPMDPSYYSEIMRRTLDDYNDYLTSVSSSQFQQGQGCDLIFVRMVTICIFSVHFAVSTEHNLLVQSAPPSPTPPPETNRPIRINTFIDTSQQSSDRSYHRHTVLESLALQTLYGLMNRTALHLTAINFKSQGKFYEVKPVYSHLIASLSVFAEWCTANTHYLMFQPSEALLIPKISSSNPGPQLTVDTGTDMSYHAVRSSDGYYSPSMSRSRGGNDSPKGNNTDRTRSGAVVGPVDWDVLYLADSDGLRNEIRAKSGMRAAMSDLRSTIGLDLDSNRHANDAKTNPSALTRGYLPMSEDVALRGFLPLADYIENKCFSDFNPIAKQFNSMKHYIALERFHRSKTVLAFIDTTLSKSKLKSPVAIAAAVATDDSVKAKPRTPSAEEDLNSSGSGRGVVRAGSSSPSSSSSMSRARRLIEQSSDEPYDNVVFKPAFSRAVDEPFSAGMVPTRGDFGGSSRMSASNISSSDSNYLVGLADHPAMGRGALYDGGGGGGGGIGPYLNFGGTAAVGASSGTGILNDANPHLNLQDDYWNLWPSAPVVSSLRGDLLFDTNPSPPPPVQSSYDSLEPSASSSRVIGSSSSNKFFLKGSQDSYDSTSNNNDLIGLGFDDHSAAWNFSFEDDFDPLAQRTSSRTSRDSRDILFGNNRVNPLGSLDAGERENYLTGTILGMHSPTGDSTNFAYTQSIPGTMSSKDLNSFNSLTDAFDSDFSNINLGGIATMDKAWSFPQESTLDHPVGSFVESSSSSFTSTGSYPIQPTTGAVYADTRPHPLRSPAVSIPPPPGLDILPTHPPVTEPPPGLMRWGHG